MKKLFLSIAALLAAGIYTADAQMWSFGPKAGVAISSANGVQDSRARAGLVAGVFAEVEMSDWFAVQGEIIYSQQGFDSKTAGKNSRYQIDFITMPLVTKYYLIGGLNVQLGAQFGYLINAKNNLPGASRQSIKGETNRYNVGILTGLAYDFDFGLVLEGRYTLALTDTFVNTAKQRGGALQVMVGWKF